MSDVITDNLDVWTSAIASKATAGRGTSDKQTAYGIKKLRELILELAVRGKLVPQDPNDEPANEFLARVVKARKQLVIERQIRQTDEVELSEPENLFTIPDGWVWVHIKDVAIVQGGKRLPTGAVFLETPTPHIYIRVTDMKNGSISEADLKYISPEVQRQISRYTINKEDLYITIAGTIGNVGIIPDSLDGQNLTENAAKLVFRLLEKRFLHLALSSDFVKSQFLEKTKQMAQPKLALKRIAGAKLCLPPLNEQYCIVAKVDELMALCDQLEQQQSDHLTAHQTLVQTLLDTLTQAADAAEFEQAWSRIADHFDTLFTTEPSIDQLKQALLQLAVMGKLVQQDPADEPACTLLARVSSEKESVRKHNNLKPEKPLPKIPENQIPYLIPRTWQWTRIGTIALSTDYGLSEKTFDDPSGIPVLKMGDIIDGRVVLGGQKTVAISTEGLANLLLEKGDLLYNRTNSAELVGKTGLYDGDHRAYSFASYLIRIRTLKQHVLPRFLNICMNSRTFRSTQIEPHLKQQCGQANVNGTIMRNMMVPIPPVEEQRRIVAKVDELMVLCDALKARIAAAQTTQLQLADTIVEQAVA